jgi:transcriptional regulator of aromatic amino acid metabolism
VELVRLYSNPEAEADHLRRVRSAASTPRPAEGLRQPRQRQRRLSMTEVTMLIKAYERQDPVRELARRFGIHRQTVTALLRRHGVELRQAGLAPADIPTATQLYGQGWSCAQLGTRFGVASTTVWRSLRAAGVVMRPP